MGYLRFGQRATGRDDPVAVAVLVATAQRERFLDVGAEEIRTMNLLPVFDQLARSSSRWTYGYTSVRFLTRSFTTRTLTPFALYSLIVGTAYIIWFSTGGA